MKEAPPPPGPVKNLEFPDIPGSRLENGLEILGVSDSYLPRISVFLGIPAGRMHDPGDKRGLSQLMADMLKEGTAKRSSRQLASEMDKYAIDFSARVYLEYTMIRCKFLENFTREALDLLTDIVYNPSFPEEEWAKAAVRWKVHLASQMSNPAYLARERLYRELFPGSPLANCSVEPSTVDALETGDLHRFFRERLIPSSGIIGFSGPLSFEEASRLAKKEFGRPGPKAGPEPVIPRLETIRRKICLVHRPGSKQAKILIGLHAPSRKSGANIRLKLLNQVYGGGGSSRIFMNLREDKGYTYGAYSYFRQSNYCGNFVVSTSVNNDAAAASIKEIFLEMERLRQDRVPEEELERCKAEINGAFLRQMETPSSICSMELTRKLVGMPQNYYRDFIPELMAVDSAQVKDTAGDLLDPDKSVIVVVGDRESIAGALESMGQVTVYTPRLFMPF